MNAPAPRLDGSVVVFGSRLSPFVEKVVRALHLKRIDHRLVAPRSPLDFKRWNPQARKMPVLELAGTRFYDSSLILRKLDEVAPDPPLFDRDPATAARQRFIEDWSDESLYWYGMGLRWSRENASVTAAQVLGSLPVPGPVRALVGLVLPRQIRRQALAQGLARLPLAVLLEELGRRFDELLVWLGGRPFLFAERVSAADLAVFGQLNMLRSGPTPQAEELIAARPDLAQYAARVDAATRR
jgi:glutathione S-transferase